MPARHPCNEREKMAVPRGALPDALTAEASALTRPVRERQCGGVRTPPAACVTIRMRDAAAIARATAPHSYVILPLVAREAVLGAIGFVLTEPDRVGREKWLPDAD